MKILLLILLLSSPVSASGEIYRWRDGGGVLHFSNSLDDVPLRYREKVKILNYGQAQKGDAVPPQVAPSANQSSPATAVSSPQKASGRPGPAPEGRMLKRQRHGVVRSASEDAE